MAHILLVEDDVSLAHMTALLLQTKGHDVTELHSGRGVVDRVREQPPDLLLLDIELPGETGLSICARARRFYAGPILLLTARQGDMDQVIGLELGADDYVVKPATPKLLVARIDALLRRRRS